LIQPPRPGLVPPDDPGFFYLRFARAAPGGTKKPDKSLITSSRESRFEWLLRVRSRHLLQSQCLLTTQSERSPIGLLGAQAELWPLVQLCVNIGAALEMLDVSASAKIWLDWWGTSKSANEVIKGAGSLQTKRVG
jgi:hypothetical protein